MSNISAYQAYEKHFCLYDNSGRSYSGNRTLWPRIWVLGPGIRTHTGQVAQYGNPYLICIFVLLVVKFVKCLVFVGYWNASNYFQHLFMKHGGKRRIQRLVFASALQTMSQTWNNKLYS